jgi:iron complex transport system substrate-binding protein
MRHSLLLGLLSCGLFLGCAQKESLPQSAKGATSARRIVSLTPGITELIYAVGAEQWLVATVEHADYPEAAKQLPRVGDAFRVDMEKLLSLKPDLVLVWTSGTPATTVEQIKALGLRVESIEAQRLNEVSASLLRIGELTGMQVNAQQSARHFLQGIAELQRRYKHRQPLSVFLEVNRRPLYTVNGQHVLSEVLTLCGGRNVFAALNQLAPVVSVEAVLKADPEVILSTDGTVQQLQADWQTWRQLRAVQNQHMYAVSPDTTTRATPRLLAGATEICQMLDVARGLH